MKHTATGLVSALPSRLASGLAAALCMLLCALVLPAQAAIFTVTNTDDSGAGSLRQAMLDAEATPDADEIVFDAAANGVITLAAPLPDLQGSGGNLTITGNGPANTIIDGADQHQPFNMTFQSNLTFSLSQLTVRNSRADQLEGGAVYAYGGSNSSVAIDGVEFVDNTATFNGGAVYSNVPLQIRNSLFTGNISTSAYGSAFVVTATTAEVSNSTFTQNAGQSPIYFTGLNASGRLTNITVADNLHNAGNILARHQASVSISNSIIVSNSPGEVDLRTDDTASFDLATSFNNLVSNTGDIGFVDGVNGNQIGTTDALLGPLGNYGGPTRTLPILPGSPALDAGTSAQPDVPASDQRGQSRVGAVDIGAFESRGFNLGATAGGGQSAAVGSAFPAPLVATVTANDPLEPVAGGVVQFSAPASGASATLAPAAASIAVDGTAQTTATANATVGGPYDVTASLSDSASVTFALSNTNAPGIIVDPTSGLVTTEDGGTATFTVVLVSEPTADVTLPFISSNPSEGTVAPSSLTFTAGNWSAPQTVTVTGVDDGVDDGDQAYLVHVGPASSTDTAYAGLSAPDVQLLNRARTAVAAPSQPVPANQPLALALLTLLLALIGGAMITPRRKRDR